MHFENLYDKDTWLDRCMKATASKIDSLVQICTIVTLFSQPTFFQFTASVDPP